MHLSISTLLASAVGKTHLSQLVTKPQSDCRRDHNLNFKWFHSLQEAPVQRGLDDEPQSRSWTVGLLRRLNLHLCRNEIRCHTVVTLQSARRSRAPQSRSLPPQSSQLHEVNENKLQCKYLFVMSFNNRTPLLCYRPTVCVGGGRETQKHSRWERDVQRCFIFSFPLIESNFLAFN